MSLNSQKNTWTRINIKDGCISITDCVNKTAKKTEYKTPYKMLRTTNIKKGWIDIENVGYVTEETYKKWTRREVPKKGDIILTREAPLGEVGLLRSDDKVFLGQRLVSYRANLSVLDNKFLFYAFLTHDLASQIKSLGSGSTVQHMRVPDAEKLTVSAPNIEIQRAIGSILCSYDDLIENNQKRIKILEEMSQLLYHEWFVKFMFPGHESVKMVESNTQYGKIPEGWEVKKLDKVASIVRGCSYSSEEIDDIIGQYYIVNLKNFNRGGGFRFDGAKYYSGQPNNNQILKTGDIVVAVTDMTNDRAVIARPARVPEIKGDITFSADVVKINSTTLPSTFIYEVMSSYRFTETTKKKANGANVLHLKPSAILEFETVIPTPELLKQYDLLCYPVAREIDKLIKQNDNLTKTRDLLIPQLVTGKRELH